jgi:hypothetical protein
MARSQLSMCAPTCEMESRHPLRLGPGRRARPTSVALVFVVPALLGHLPISFPSPIPRATLLSIPPPRRGDPPDSGPSLGEAPSSHSRLGKRWVPTSATARCRTEHCVPPNVRMCAGTVAFRRRALVTI